MKYLMLICDGMADLPAQEFGNKTPLEFANTPNFDLIAKKGITGLMDPIGSGVKPGSDTGHLSIFGYDLETEYCGRGPLEALGAGIKLEHGDVAFRANIATVDDGFVIKDRRAGRIRGDLSELEKALNEIDLGVEFTFHHTIEHRGVLVLKGCSANISDTDPHEIGKKIPECMARDTDSEKTAEIVNEFTKKANEVLKNLELNKNRELPANAILLRGAGEYKHVQSFKDKYKLKGACIAAIALVRGVASYIGMDLLDVEGMTGNENTNIKGKFETAVKALETHDFVMVNIKAPDLFGHDGNFEGKAGMIEKIDSYMPILINGIGDNTLVVTADHATPVSLRDHSGDPVPLAISSSSVSADNVSVFGEQECASGGLHRIIGKEFMQNLLKT